MNSLLRKELRLLLPAWVATVVMVVVPAGCTHAALFARNGWSVGMACFVCFSLGILFLALSPFGQEISLGTFGLLLAQPRERRQLWWAKMGSLGLAVILSLAVMCLSWYLRGKGTVILRGMPLSNTLSGGSDLIGFGALAAVVMVSGGLWTTLVFRQVTAAFWFSLLIPGAIFTAVEATTRDESTASLREVIVMATYSLVGFLLAAKLFLKAQDKPQGQGQISLPTTRGYSLRLLAFAFKGRRPAWVALFYKELQLQQITLMVALGLGVISVGLEMIAFAMSSGPLGFIYKHSSANRGLVFPDANGSVLLGFIYGSVEWYWILCLFIPLMIGSVAVADERRLNTLPGQFCLPLRKRSVFAGKFLAVLFLGGLLGAVIPWLHVCTAIWARTGTFPPALSSLAAFAIPCALIAAISFYASTLSQTGIQALGIAFVLNLITFFAISVVLPFHEFVQGSGPFRNHDTVWREPVNLCDRISQFCVMDLHLNAWAWPVAIATYLWLSYENFQRLQMNPRVWLRNLIVLVSVSAGTLFVSNVVHARPWEPFTRLEPVHGPARIVDTPSSHVKIAAACVLLPDGRVWARSSMWSSQLKSKRGRFVEMSNWIDIAPFWDGAVGIQSDHTLWQIDSLAKTARIGGDSNWQAVAAFNGSFLALKKDGTLWRSPSPIISETNMPDQGRGSVRAWLTLPNPDTTPVPMEFYPSNWKSLTDSSGEPIGVYGDGTVWQFSAGTRDFSWGRPGVDSRLSYDFSIHSCSVAVTNWMSMVHSEPSFWAGVSREGGLWAAGILPNRLFGQDCPPGRHDQPVRIAGSSEWREVSGDNFAKAAIEKNGTLWLQFEQGLGEAECPSANSDWIAATATFTWVTSLAADGTLSTWNPQYQSVLGLPEPKHRPVASVNIFDTK